MIVLSEKRNIAKMCDDRLDVCFTGMRSVSGKNQSPYGHNYRVDFTVEKIMDERQRKLSVLGSRIDFKYIVKWQGYTNTICEPTTPVEDTSTLDDYLEELGGM